ncbi:MAG: magnesium transporter MgtC [Confluentimicrobium sp.]|jgi:putative Mg2+ transporter-C (MgtC) family protein|uniref:Protein MgtC n=1 Tax=Actibacterium naphthalenivorans TaxID=1614693 RepID=A0A840CCD3_9RHOB|nr:MULTISPECIES: MgtC/SapB family protein [Actibacterium]ALG90761.1 hypothetical protein TQ29_11900 [Actibacterium sp. EMB200-NS6]MBB4023025.1 putative Mg2+ transporter-C (MgtC) family protein [Actibacterium naphthalenivorans]MBC55571.1 magnesium transporter MgtC [Actibacterium sp.]|tara:strand:- start:1497 stop:1985 length:489 start_codon:yes stop_codon:yes gene_type:complete
MADMSLMSDFSRPFAVVAWDISLVRLCFALVLGGAIGWEREVHNRNAGLRTHMMISLAACLFTLIAFDLTAFPGGDEGFKRVDPLRLIEAVTSGVAFLAAGSIITSGARVRGLTTGAGMWMAGAIGLTCGVGNLPLALMATALALVVMWLLRRVVDAARDEE